MTPESLTVFAFESAALRTVFQDGDPWFVAKDVCFILELTNVGQALARLDADERRDIILNDVTGRNQEMSILNESGLYSLALGSRKPQAKAFKKWVTSEVLPSIRKTGFYGIDPKWNDIRQLIALGSTPDKAYAVVSKAQTRALKAAKPAKPTPEPIQFFQILEDSNLWAEPQHHIKALRTWIDKHGSKTPAWLGSVDKLAATLLKSSNPARQEAQTLLKAVPLITILRTLAQSHPERIQTGRIRSERFWVIQSPAAA